MILYYAIGGGLGHLTRARGVAHTLRFEEGLAIVTASPLAHDRRIVGDAEAIVVPSDLSRDIDAFRAWLGDLFERLAPTAIYVDTFPAGILGELCDFPFPPTADLYHVARLLRWEEYRGLISGASPRYRRIYQVEPLVDEHEAFLREHSEEIAMLDPSDPPATLDRGIIGQLHEWSHDGTPLWLIVHSGPEEEIAELLAYARDLAAMEKAAPRFLLVAPHPAPSPDLFHLDIYPAYPLFPHVARIITACGFNVMRQAHSYRNIHRFLPFARRYDDQFTRAARNRMG